MRFTLVLVAAAAAGQSFEVATVKPAAPSSVRGGRTSVSGDRAVYGNTTLASLLLRAFDAKFAAQIAGPAWIFTERYDIAAKTPGPTAQGEILIMLRNLLMERFRLEIHHETREFAGYALVIAKHPLKLERDEDTSGPMDTVELREGRRYARKMSMTGLARWLSLSTQRPVIDATNLGGVYSFAFEMSIEELGGVNADPANQSAPSIFSIVEGLGLKLEPRKIPLDVIVVDQASRLPIDN